MPYDPSMPESGLSAALLFGDVEACPESDSFSFQDSNRGHWVVLKKTAPRFVREMELDSEIVEENESVSEIVEQKEVVPQIAECSELVELTGAVLY